jgi:hypothetical protein
METIRDRFVTHMLTGLSARAALAKALVEASTRIEKEASRHALPSILSRLGLTDLIGKASIDVLRIVNRQLDGILSFVPVPGGVTSVPSPECIEAQLPKDRPATGDDIEKAWDICIAGTSK